MYIISGLWHGANWNFILWGVHAVYQIVGAFIRYIKGKIFKERNCKNIVFKLGGKYDE